MPSEPLVTLVQIRAAAAILKGIAAHTPLLPFGPPDRQHYLRPIAVLDQYGNG